MEQLIFVGVILVFTILDAIARKAKKQAQEQQGPVLLPEEWEELEEGVGAEEVEGSTWLPGPSAKPPTARRSGPSSSEGLIPSDVWEEIQSLARGGRAEPSRPSRPTPAPRPSRPEPSRSRTPTRARVPTPRRREEHPVHLTHPQMGQPMSGRLTALDKPHRTPGPSAEMASVRSLLSGGGDDLRKAVILHEVLGPPASMRGEPHEPSG